MSETSRKPHASAPTPRAAAQAAPTEPQNAGEDTTPDGEPIVFTDKRRRSEGHEAQASTAAPPSPEAARIGQLEAQLAEREAHLQATRGQYKEALDEFTQVKARLKRDIDKEIAHGKRALLSQLLEVLDNLERAIDAAQADPAQAKMALCEGVTMVRDQFRARLEQLGVRKIAALGEPFDPAHFEAVANVPVTDPKQDGRVVGVVRDAYLLGEETLRHGIVAVGQMQPS